MGGDSFKGSQPGKPAALGLRDLPQAWTKNTDTRSRSLSQAKAQLRTQTWALCTAPTPNQ